LFPAIRQDGESGGFIDNDNIFIQMKNNHLASIFCRGIDFALFANRLCLNPVPAHMIAPPRKRGLYANTATTKKRPPKIYSSAADSLYENHFRYLTWPSTPPFFFTSRTIKTLRRCRMCTATSINRNIPK